MNGGNIWRQCGEVRPEIEGREVNLFSDNLRKEYFVRVGGGNIWRERGERIFGESGGREYLARVGEENICESEEREYLTRVWRE